ncbi:MAG TPA: hypothetical protein VH054_07095 [Polyangiaceae bacterium]|nr:hypothetical protein [Polyangiaceae bacterium]
MKRLQRALASERRARRFLLANLIDDVGVAVSVWAMAMMHTDLMRDQRERAKLVVPVLLVMVVGTLTAGPIADFARRWSPALLPRWRRNVLLVARGVETFALAGVVCVIASGPVTIARFLPYALVSGFLKTALRPTRIALAVDLLDHEEIEDGLDERGEPRRRKTFLPTFAALTSQLSSGAVLLGLVLGGKMMTLAHGRVWTLLAFDVITNVVFLAILATVPAPAATVSVTERPARRFELVRFLAARPQRPLVALLLGAWMIEFVNELYDGKMIVRHLLGGTTDAVRFSEIAWNLAAVVALAALPAILARVRLGVAFTVAMLADGLVVGVAGAFAARGVPAAIAPFALAIGADRALTAVASTLVGIAQASATSTAMRGRLAGAWQLWVIVTCIAAEGAATAAADSWGIGAMMRVAGLVQIAAIAALAVFALRANVEVTARSRA